MLCALHHVISNNNIAQLHGSLWRAETSRCAVSHITLFITLTPTGLLTPWKKEKGKSSDATQIGSNNIILLLPPTYYTTTYNDLVYISFFFHYYQVQHNNTDIIISYPKKSKLFITPDAWMANLREPNCTENGSNKRHVHRQ